MKGGTIMSNKINITAEFLNNLNEDQIHSVAKQMGVDTSAEDFGEYETTEELADLVIAASASKSKNNIWNPKSGIGLAACNYMREHGRDALTPEVTQEIALGIKSDWLNNPDKPKTHSAWYRGAFKKRQELGLEAPDVAPEPEASDDSEVDLED